MLFILIHLIKKISQKKRPTQQLDAFTIGFDFILYTNYYKNVKKHSNRYPH